MQGPFSELTKLELKLLSSDDRVPVVPEWIRPSSAITPFLRHSISEIAEVTFVFR
jgi:hypothetical protein